MDIVIDFDGTCVTHDFPKIGKDIGAVKVLKKLVDNGHNLILFTMRSDRTESKHVIDPTIKNVTGKFLTDAVNWFKENNIPLYGIQNNPTQYNWTTSPKAYGQLIIDDAALGCPLKLDKSISSRPFVDWEAVEKILSFMKLIERNSDEVFETTNEFIDLDVVDHESVDSFIKLENETILFQSDDLKVSTGYIDKYEFDENGSILPID